jgi:hypothetical protein
MPRVGFIRLAALSLAKETVVRALPTNATDDTIFGGRSICVPRSCCPPQRNDALLVCLPVVMARSQCRHFLDQTISRLRRHAIFRLVTKPHSAPAKSAVDAPSFFCRHFDATNVQVSLGKRNFDAGFSQGLGDCDGHIALKLKPCVLPGRPEAQLKVQ